MQQFRRRASVAIHPNSPASAFLPAPSAERREFPQKRPVGSEVMTHDDGGMAASNIDNATKRAGIPPQHVRIREAAIANVSRAVIHNSDLPA
jgi:hypothetical protein